MLLVFYRPRVIMLAKHPPGRVASENRVSTRCGEASMEQHLRIEHVQVQTINWCNRSCAFCPSQKFELEHALMSVETYQRVLEELAAIDFKGRFSPYLMNEPLLDKRLARFIAMTREALPGAQILIQSNGDALTVERGVELYRAGLHKMIVNCYDNKNDRLSRLRAIMQQIVREVPGLEAVNRDLFRMISFGNSGRHSLHMSVQDVTHWTVDNLTNRAGNTPGAKVPSRSLKKSCFRPFHQLYVRFNGDAVLCCCDWKGEVVFGNLGETSLPEVYNSDMARAYRENLKKKNRNMKLCSVCDFRGNYALPRRVLGWIERKLK